MEHLNTGYDATEFVHFFLGINIIVKHEDILAIVDAYLVFTGEGL